MCWSGPGTTRRPKWQFWRCMRLRYVCFNFFLSFFLSNFFWQLTNHLLYIVGSSWRNLMTGKKKKKKKMGPNNSGSKHCLDSEWLFFFFSSSTLSRMMTSPIAHHQIKNWRPKPHLPLFGHYNCFLSFLSLYPN